ncbi:MAG: FAD-dependent oxidoreductase [Spirochaetales bacterium]|nr:MAG: FAD-dependent oxidoreductase [Spirochaetales bacterium]
MNEYTEAQIISVKIENPSVSSFEIKPLPPRFAERKAGQYLLLKIKKENEWSEPHPFTITSRLSEDFVGITVKKLGKFTNILHSIKPPAPVMIQGPLGKFADNVIKDNKSIFIAGGIGITPFISILDYLAYSKSSAKIILFWANENIEDLFYLDQLHDLSKKINLKIILVINNLDKNKIKNKYSFDWKNGYLTRETLSEYIIDQTTKFYMCGSPNMQKYLFAQLELLKIVPAMIDTEKFGIYMGK